MATDGYHPLDEDTRSRLDAIEREQRHQSDSLSRLTKFLDRAEPWIDEWVGRGNGNDGVRGQVIEALDERRAAKVGATLMKWLVGIGSSATAIWAVFHEVFKK